MLVYPVFKYHFQVEIHKDEEVVYLLSEKRHHCLRGYLYRLLAPLLDGKHRVSDIVEDLQLFFPETRIHEALSHLEKQGYIVEADESLPRPEAAFWNLEGIDTRHASSKIKSITVSVKAVGRVSAEPFIELLSSLGICTGEDGDLTVLITDDYLHPELNDLNLRQIDIKKPWVIVKPIGAILWIGPLFVNGETGCWECLAHRLRGNQEVETSLQMQLGKSSPFTLSRAMLPTTLTTGFSLAATQVALSLAHENRAALSGIMLTIDMASLKTEKHILTRRPQCPACGSPAQKPPQALNLKSRIKMFTEDGGHRICSPTETLRRFGHHISPITGVVSELRPIFRDGNGLVSIYCGVHEIPRMKKNFKELQASLRNKSTGKGKSELQSQASAFSEAVERYSAVFRGDEYRIRKSFSQMGETAIPINHCLLYSDDQYHRRQEWNRTHLSLEYVPVPLDPDKAIDWTPVWSLTSQSFKYIPTACCYSGYFDPTDGNEPYYNVDSTGLAAGNVVEEAILQGFLEVIERDAVSIWWYNLLKRPAVDLSSFHDDYYGALSSYYASLNRALWVLDITTDSGIPSFVALSRRLGGEAERLLFGFGSHFDARIGISRALTEMNQGLYLLSDGRISDHAPSERERFMKKWNQMATLENQPYLSPDSALSTKNRGSYPKSHNHDLLDDIKQCIEIAKKMECELLVHNLTHPDIGMPVVKVIVPGLRPIRARFAPGRLYDVPVKRGWIKEPLNESELNPIPLWL